ncbi:hypothetical protein DSO57_1037832 [Entomophthora muscae]|uniref:Uncharacterized protein n=1 Tax=Entomophthora muscae TaxID=34485 RepID=A0ACC2TA91_9FUNG|nr:hypothetical protein DSO57_1037832 [Entomophthora muscae]
MEFAHGNTPLAIEEQRENLTPSKAILAAYNLARLRQDSSVCEYIYAYTCILESTPEISPTDVMLRACFLKGLQANIAVRIDYSSCQTIQDCYFEAKASEDNEEFVQLAQRRATRQSNCRRRSHPADDNTSQKRMKRSG